MRATVAIFAATSACAPRAADPESARVEFVSGCPGGSAGVSGGGGEGGETVGGQGGEATGGTAGSSGASGSAGAPLCSTAAELTDELTFSVLRAGLLDGSSGSAWEQARDVAWGANGTMYVVGGTSAADFPTTTGAHDRTLGGTMDFFVTAFAPDGAVAWSTYVGGPNYDLAYAVEVDSTGVYVAGRCGSGFPVTSGAHQTTFAGDSVGGLYGQQDGCVSKLAPDGSSLLWSTFIGDSGPAIVRDIAVDSSNRVHVGVERAYSSMSSKVTTGAPQTTVRGTMDTFYLRLSANGSAVEFGTYLGGTETASYTDGNPSVRVLGDAAYVLTSEPATNYPATAGGLQPVGAGGYDMLLAKFTGNEIAWTTYLGGSGDERHDTHSLAVTQTGEAVLAVITTSQDFPGGSAIVGGTDIGVAVVSADGSTLVAATTLGGSGDGTTANNGDDAPEGISVDACGNIYVTGATRSTNLPTTDGSVYPGARSGLAVVLSPDLQTRRYVSYDGIPGQYANRSSALAPDGSWAVVGSVWQLNPFPSVGGYDSSLTGTHGAFFQVLEVL